MLRKIKPYLTTIIIIVIVLLITYVFLAPFLWTSEASTAGGDSHLVSGQSITDSNEQDPDTLLTYQAFRQYENTKTSWKAHQRIINRGVGNGITLAFIGAGTTENCDTCTELRSTFNNRTTQYYLLLPGYMVSDNGMEFYRKRDSSFVQVTRWDSTKKEDNGYNTHYGHYEQKQIPYRFRFTDWESTSPQRGSVMIPISERTYNILYPVIRGVQFLLAIFMLYILLVWPAKMLIRISRGEIFTHQNIRQLNIIAGILLISPVVIVALKYILKWSFHQYLTPEVYLRPIEILIDQQIFIFPGLIALAIAKAFRKGLLLQEEQTLTV